MLTTRRKWMFGISLLLTTILFTWVVSTVFKQQEKEERNALTLEQRIQLSLKISKYRLIETINYLKRRSGAAGRRFPRITRQPPFRNQIYQYFPNLYQAPQSMWAYGRIHFWSAGAFPGLLWKMHQYEANVAMKKYWKTNAKAWSEPLRYLNYENLKDVAINNLFVFRSWYENSEGKERQ